MGSGMKGLQIFRFTGKRLFQFLLTIFLLSLLVFFMSRLAPGDPLRSYYGDSIERMTIQQLENSRERLGLNDSLINQYGIWFKNALVGDLGISYKYKQSVLAPIKSMGLNTLFLAGTAYVITFGAALYVGGFCALREDGWMDKLLCKIGVVIGAIPAFFIAILFILIFAVYLDWLPAGGAYTPGEAANFWNRILHLILPTFVLVVGHLWYYAYMVRNLLLEEMGKGYVLLCKVKGLSKRKTLWKHCMINILPIYLTMMAVSVPHFLGGTYVVEKVFSYPGLGTLLIESAQYHDYNMLMALTLLTGSLVVFVNFVVGLINVAIDPRIKTVQHESRGLYVS